MRLTQSYAEALYQSAEDDSQALAWLEELERIDVIFKPIASFIEWVDLHPEAFQVISQELDGKFSAGLLSFLRVLSEDGLLHEHESIHQAYQLILMDQGLFYDVTIESAEALSSKMTERLTAMVEERWGPAYALDFQVQPNLIHGLRVSVNNEVIDTSLRKRLDTLKKGVES